MLRALRHVCFLLPLATVITPVHGAVGTGYTGPDPPTSNEASTSNLSTWTASTSQLSNATCISRTVNYITHTLPQQCLRTDRTAWNGTQSSSVSRSSNSTSILSPTSAQPPPDTAPTSRHPTEDVTPIAVSSTISIVIASGETTTTTSSEGTGTASLSKAPGSTVGAIEGSETEADPLLDNANFLSFGEWKKQNLAKTGQSPDTVGQERPPSNEGRQRPGINNALDTLGEESEIDLDFSGFGGGAVARPSDVQSEPKASPGAAEEAAESQSASTASKLRSKDAGKTCKERTNYASFDCSASVMKTNSESKSPSSVLVENKDSYMLNTCTAKNKFFIVELCNDIHIDTIVLANYEFFSSIFRHFRVSVSDRYPVKMDKWRELGTFEARNTREVQAFLVEDPQIWARYLRVEFLTHYGSEYYCPVSLLRVHGKTMMQEFRQEEEMARGELSDDESIAESESTPSSVLQEPPMSTDEAEKATIQAMPTVGSSAAAALDAVVSKFENSSTTEPSSTAVGSKNATASVIAESATSALDDMTCAISAIPASGSTSAVNSTSSSDTAEPSSDAESSAALPFNTDHDTSESHSSTPATNPTLPRSRATSHELTEASEPQPTTSALASTAPNSTMSATRSTESTSLSAPSSLTSASTNTTRSTAVASPSPQASSQESFFKSIHKRLQQLESNSTLSLQYIEEQSRILRDAFNKVEKRQISATTAFLSQLNGTVMTELQGFRQAYDQLWQSTVIELEGQREQYQREMLALSTRLTFVADELVWQKRMGIVQSTLLLLCLGLVLFARHGNGYLDMTLAQQLMTKSQAAFRGGWESEPNSPSPVSRSPVSVFRRRIWRSSTEPANGALSDGTDTRPQTRDGAPDVEIEPPTPPTEDGQAGAEEDQADDSDLPGTQSGPGTPGGTAAGLKRTSSAADGSRPGSPLRYE